MSESGTGTLNGQRRCRHRQHERRNGSCLCRDLRQARRDDRHPELHNGTGSDTVNVGQFSGIERFSVAEDTQLYFVGGTLNATVTGSQQDDVLIFGADNETFNGRGGQDDFVIFTMPGMWTAW